MTNLKTPTLPTQTDPKEAFLADLKAKYAEMGDLIRAIERYDEVAGSKEIISPHVEKNTLTRQTVEKIPQNISGVTEFILHVLKSGPFHTSDIITKYATWRKKTVKEVESNVSNALTRLKNSDRIDNKPNGTSKREGSTWFLTHGKN